MTSDDEVTFIQLWQAGASYRDLAQALGCALGTVGSRASALVAQGKIQPRPRGGAYPKQKALARSDTEGGPSTAHRPRWTLHRPPSILCRRTSPPPSPPPCSPCWPAWKLWRPGSLNTPMMTVHRPPWTLAPWTVHRLTVHPDTWELKQLKHSIRWTVYVPQAMREELQRRAAARGQNPSLLVQEALARWLAEEA
jgi:hypothetical protein